MTSKLPDNCTAELAMFYHVWKILTSEAMPTGTYRNIGTSLFILACTMRAVHIIFRQPMSRCLEQNKLPRLSLYSVVQILDMALP